MTDFALPPNHHHEVLQGDSPAVWLERGCAVTGERLRAGEVVVVCDYAPGQDPISEEGWRTVNSCPHCGQLARPAPIYMAPVWGAPATTPVMTPVEPPTRRSPFLLAALAALLLLAAGAVTVAALIYARRTGETTPTATVAVVFVTATPAGATTAPTDAPPAATSTLRPVKTQALAATPQPVKTAAIIPTPPPSPTTAVQTGIAAISLVNPGRNDYLFELRDGATVDLSEVGTNYLTIVADVGAQPVGSVAFYVDGQPHCRGATCVENTPPYYMHGDVNGDPYDDWDWRTMLGDHTISAMACTGPNATGECYPALEIALTIVR